MGLTTLVRIMYIMLNTISNNDISLLSCIVLNLSTPLLFSALLIKICI